MIENHDFCKSKDSRFYIMVLEDLVSIKNRPPTLKLNCKMDVK